MIALFWRAIKGRSLRDGRIFTSGPESKNRFNRRPAVPSAGGWSADRAESGVATSLACCQPLQHTDWIEHPIVVVLMGTEKVVVGDPERHVIVGAIVIVVTAT